MTNPSNLLFVRLGKVPARGGEWICLYHRTGFFFFVPEPASDPPKSARERAGTMGGAARRPDKSESCTSI